MVVEGVEEAITMPKLEVNNLSIVVVAKKLLPFTVNPEAISEVMLAVVAPKEVT